MSLTLSKPRRSRKLPRSRPASRRRAWSRSCLTSSPVRSASGGRACGSSGGAGGAAGGGEKERGPGEPDPAHQQVAEGGRLFGGQPAGPAVGDDAVAVEGAEVDPGGHVARLELEADAGR